MRGSIVKRGTTWSYIVDIGRGSNGKRQQKWKGGFATKREAEKALSQVLHELHSQRYVEPSKLTLAAYLRDEWLPAIAPPNLRESTWTSYRAELEKHVIPHLGHILLPELNAPVLNKTYAYLLHEGRLNRPGGLSARTVRYAHTILRKALADAVRWGHLDRNVADLARPPRPERPHDDAGMQTWTAAQLARFLRHAADHRLYPAWLLAASTGMRRGEVLGLRWTDVDLQQARLAVRQTLIVVQNRVQFSEPKTKRSRRSIDLDTRTVGALRQWHTTQQGDRDGWGAAYQNSDLVFTREDGSSIYPEGWSKTFERLSREAGLPVIRLHDLRHTHASLLLASGVNPKVVSERLGHHSVAFTLDVYAHVIPGMQAEAANKVAEFVHGPEGQPGNSPTDANDPAR